MHEVFFRPFLRATKELVSLVRNKERGSLGPFSRGTDRQPSQINSLSGGIISPKWPFINKRPTGPRLLKDENPRRFSRISRRGTTRSRLFKLEDFRVSFARFNNR